MSTAKDKLKKAKKKSAKKDLLTYAPDALEITPIELQDITAFYSKEYGSEVVEDRAIPDFRDGLKPVHRAIIWAMYVNKFHHNTKPKKAARTVGDVIGKFHPHGDSAAYGAMVTIANNIMPNLVDGQGNWGDHVDNAAHYRYTEARLSMFTDTFLLDKDYLAVMPMVENFDGTEKWPLFLPAKLPVQLLCGSPTVPAYGVSAGTPPFHIEGVARLVELALKGKKITPKLCLKYLKLNLRYGGVCVSDEETYLNFYATGKGSFRFIPETEIEGDYKTYHIHSCSPGFGSEKSINNALTKLSELDGVNGVSDNSGHDAGRLGIDYAIGLKKMSEDKLETTLDKIEKIISGSAPYDIGYTHRRTGDTTFGRMSVAQFFTTWTKYRVSLEVAVIKHLVRVEQKKLERQELMLWAVDHLDTIMNALRDKKLGPKKHLLKVWKEKDEEFVDSILSLAVRQLAALERPPIVTKIKEINAEIKVLKADLKDPNARILRTFKTDVSEYINKTRAMRKKDADTGDRIE